MYTLVYNGSCGVWKRSVSLKKYNQAQVGEIIESVFLENEKSPVLSYSDAEGVV